MKPREIIIQRDCLDFPVAKRLKKQFLESDDVIYREADVSDQDLCTAPRSDSSISQIKSTWLVSQRKSFSIDTVGSGTNNPACDYDLEFIYGCPHQCTFCQQLYSCEEIPCITIYPDLQRILRAVQDIVHATEQPLVIFEAGNMTDLLALESATCFLQEMIPFWAQELDSRARLHFLTKSDRVQELLHLDHMGMTRVGFSLNLPEFTRRYEPGTATRDRRLQAIRAVLKSGYKLHLSFSPIIYREGILARYERLIAETKTFLLSCDEFDESDLTVEALILFQKKDGQQLMRRYYPRLAEELIQHWEYRRAPSGDRYCYPQQLYDELRSFLKGCFDTYFPRARVLFIS